MTKQEEEKTKVKLNIQLALGILLVISGLVLLFLGFYAVPIGEITNSVLVAYGEVSTFAGSLIGVDYSYRFKTFKIEEEEKTRRHNKEQPKEEEEVDA
jgi:hypothetical protein